MHPERDADILAMIDAGSTYKAVAEKHGISRARVGQVAWKMRRIARAVARGIDPEPPPGTPRTNGYGMEVLVSIAERPVPRATFHKATAKALIRRGLADTVWLSSGRRWNYALAEHLRITPLGKSAIADRLKP